jgi:hypothetical protein
METEDYCSVVKEVVFVDYVCVLGYSLEGVFVYVYHRPLERRNNTLIR